MSAPYRNNYVITAKRKEKKTNKKNTTDAFSAKIGPIKKLVDMLQWYLTIKSAYLTAKTVKIY